MIRPPSRSYENFVCKKKYQDPSFLFEKDRNQLFNFEQIARCRNTFETCYHFFFKILNNDGADFVLKIVNENTMCVLFD